MHRFFLPPESCAGDALRIEGREAHHALHVLRVKHGESVVVLDGAGHEFLCEIADASRDAVTLRVRQKNSIPPSSCQITLWQALPRGKIIESIIQKSAELGAHRIVPLLTERVVIHLDEKERAHKQKKWQQVAVEAIKQCGAAWLPEIATPTPIEHVLASRNAGLRPGLQPSTFNPQPSTFRTVPRRLVTSRASSPARMLSGISNQARAPPAKCRRLDRPGRRFHTGRTQTHSSLRRVANFAGRFGPPRRDRGDLLPFDS